MRSAAGGPATRRTLVPPQTGIRRQEGTLNPLLRPDAA
ncbi:hypothetical protein SFOMI_4400 [Sphingobium fuliginis]|uniref:Uncharacterized protein n=1 Tax=Sphingobium fuliginis (strain ATCC 27551) TaxID=336203 RepID=A0A292ZGH6_SPHSA|nr:hypothetical protein SFOMI_4400 [Sphingobium fuliginis]